MANPLFVVVDSRREAGGDLGRAGNGTAYDQRKRTGVEGLHGLLRRVDVALGNNFGRALAGQLGDVAKVHIVDALGLGGVAAHGGADEIRTGFGAGHGVLDVIAIGHQQLAGVFCLDGADEVGAGLAVRAQCPGALRPDGQTSAEFIRAIKEKYPDQLVMADCDNIENALACAGAGADFVGTTMRGYTPETTGINDVDFGFIAQLARECPAKVIAEGHIHTPEQAVQALYAGAFALVVGGAITRPAEITARYTAAINNHK